MDVNEPSPGQYSAPRRSGMSGTMAASMLAMAAISAANGTPMPAPVSSNKRVYHGTFADQIARRRAKNKLARKARKRNRR